MYEKGKYGGSDQRNAKRSGTINSKCRRSGESHFKRKTVLKGIKWEPPRIYRDTKWFLVFYFSESMLNCCVSSSFLSFFGG